MQTYLVYCLPKWKGKFLYGEASVNLSESQVSAAMCLSSTTYMNHLAVYWHGDSDAV